MTHSLTPRSARGVELPLSVRSLAKLTPRAIQGTKRDSRTYCDIKGRGIGTPVLLMSAVYNDADQSTRTVQLGTLADGYLTKPFDLVSLLSQVRKLLGEA